MADGVWLTGGSFLKLKTSQVFVVCQFHTDLVSARPCLKDTHVKNL